jgi:fibronectin type 3 domain-containing protein
VDGLIAPLWADHNIDHSGSIHYGVISYPDYPGSGSLCYSYVVAWNQIGEQDGTGAWTTHTFAVAFQFDPNSPDNIWWRAITFLYGDVNQFAHGCYCVGLETQTGNTGVAVDHAKAVDNWVLKFEPNDAHGLVVKDIRLEAGKGSGERFYSQIEIFGPQKVGVAPNENPAGGYNVVAVDADTVNAWKDTQQSALRHALWQGASATVRTGLVIVDPSGTGVLSALYGWGRTAYYLSEYFKYVPFPDYDQISEMGIVTPCHAKVVCRDEGIPAGWGGERNYYAYDSCLATKIVWTIFPTDNPIPVSLKFRASVTLRDTSSYYTPVGLDTVADSGQWTTITVYPSLITDNGINGNSWSARTFPDAHYVRSATGTTDNIPGHTGWPFYHMDCAGRPAGETGYSAVSWTKLTENLLDNHFVTKQQDVLRISGFFKKSDSAPLNVYIVRAKDMDFLGSGSIDDVLVKEVLLAADQHGWINVAAKDIDLSAYAHLLPNPTPENPDPRLFVKVCIGMDVSDPLKSYEVFFSGVGIQTVGPAQAPNPPQNLAAAGGHGAIVLSWTAPTYDGGASVTLYKIYGGATSGSEPFLADVIAPTLMYTNLGLANGAKFYYKVTAVNTAGQSVFSNEASATTWTIPSEPTSLVATPGNQQVVLAWSSPTSNGGDPVDLYKIYKGTTSGGETYLAQVGGTILTYTSTGLTNGLTYYFKVSAVNAAGEGPLSNEASATPSVPTVPGAPKNLAATSAPTGISLIWAAPDVGVPNHYNIYRGTRAGLETLYASTIDATTSYTDTGATPGKRYFYYVSAVNSVGAGPASNEVKCTWAGGPPSAPQNLIAAPGNGQVKLTWSAPSTNGGATISGYRIYRGPTSGGEAYVTQVSGTTLTYTNTGLTNGLIYYFKVTALNSNGEGPFSNEVSASPTSATSPGAPLGLTAVPSGNAIHLAWSPPSSNGGSTITGYNIYRGTRSGVETYLGWVPGSSTFFDDGSAAKGKKYFYKVSAVNVVGEGPMSNEASATIPRAAAATIIGSTILLSEPSVDAQLLESWMAAGSFEAKATSLAVPEMRTAAA